MLTPTYSGCPATEVIEHDVLDAIDAAGLGPARVDAAPRARVDHRLDQRRRPRKLREYGIAPPRPGAAPDGARADPHLRAAGAAAVACPRCGSAHTERLSAFGSTACKALYRCLRLPRTVRTLQADLTSHP